MTKTLVFCSILLCDIYGNKSTMEFAKLKHIRFQHIFLVVSSNFLSFQKLNKAKERDTLHEHRWKVHWLFALWDQNAFFPQLQTHWSLGHNADHEMCSREEHGNEEEKTGLNNWLIICALSILPVPSSTMKFYF